MVEREARNQADFRNTQARNNEEGRADTLLAPSEVEPPSPHPGHEEDVREQPSPSRRVRWRWLIYLLILAVIGIGAWRFLAPQGSNKKHAPPEPQPVGAAKVIVGDINQTLSGLGTVTPLATITVQTQISGQLTEVGFKEGQIVHKGDFLAQIDPRPYQAALDQAEGTLGHDQGLLDQAQSDLARYQKLGKAGQHRPPAGRRPAVPGSAGQGHREGGSGGYRDREAQPRLLPHHRPDHRSRRPQTGRSGQLRADVEPTGLVVLTQLQPISVIFVLPEDAIQDIWREFRRAKS